jgi:hypothetical protein
MENVGGETTSGKALLANSEIAAANPWSTGIVGPLEVEECEAVATYTYERVGLDPSKPAAPGLLCEMLYGTRPVRASGLPRPGLMGRVDGKVRIFVDTSVSPAKARHVSAHELAHALLGRYHDEQDRILESHCDALGACLLVPSAAFRALAERYTSLYDLAHALGVTQSLALLRLGEVTGRPVKLLGRNERVRGEPFDWPDTGEALRGLHRCRVHPVRLADEEKWGLMAVGGMRRAG